MVLSAQVRDYIGAGLVVLLGLGFALQGANYPMGSLLRPGPGFFPTAVGVLLAVIGLAIAVEVYFLGVETARPALEEELEETPDPSISPVRVLGCITLGILAFGLSVDRLGFIPAALALILISAAGQPRRNWLAVVIVAVCSVAVGTAVFIWGLGVPFQPLGAK